MIAERFFILTGAPGSGKSTLLQRLRTLGFQGIDEPARPILAEQRRIDGKGLPGRDARLFVDLMLARAIDDYNRMDTAGAPVFFDRGIPDNLGYASLFGFDHASAREAARTYRYNRVVFFVPAWEQIYTHDEERTMSFAAARSFGEDLRDVYENLGYSLIDVPCSFVEERVEFILNLL